eukprot:ANDGO_06860.mRNA.2 hypothetical protein
MNSQIPSTFPASKFQPISESPFSTMAEDAGNVSEVPYSSAKRATAETNLTELAERTSKKAKTQLSPLVKGFLEEYVVDEEYEDIAETDEEDSEEGSEGISDDDGDEDDEDENDDNENDDITESAGSDSTKTMSNQNVWSDKKANQLPPFCVEFHVPKFEHMAMIIEYAALSFHRIGECTFRCIPTENHAL